MEKIMTDIKKFKDLLLEVPEITSAEHVKSVPSAITTSWSEEIWTEDMISRDTLQNFYDGCTENKLPISDIKISTDNDIVRIYAPNEFNLEKLYYIGSTKSESETPMIGAHGEGGKKVFSDLARMGVFNPILISGDKALIVSVGSEVPNTDGLRPLIYNYFSINKLKGNYFIIKTINKKLKKAYQYGMKNFFYKENKMIGEILHDHNGISIFKSNDSNGVGFYKNLRRIDIVGIPVIIHINKSYAALDKKVKMDRDRKAFDSKLQATFFSILARSGFYYRDMVGNEAIKYILKSSKKIWEKGHLLLSALATNSYGWLKDDKSLKELFGNQYFAESRFTYSRDISYSEWFNTSTQNYIRSRTSKEKKKKTILPSYFTNFGVMSALESFIRNKKNSDSRIKNKKTKDLTSKEQKSIDFLFAAAKSISPSFAKLFAATDSDDPLFNVQFKTITCKDLLGELKDKYDYNHKVIYLHKSLFKESFGKMFSTFLHELSHALGGYDGDRSFSDCLTVLIQKCIDNNSSVKKYGNQWSKLIN